MCITLGMSTVGLANAGIWSAYSSFIPKILKLNSATISAQKKAFIISTLIQGVLQYKDECSKKKTVIWEELLTCEKFFRFLTPYILTGGVSIYSETVPLKATLISAFALGTSQLAISHLASKLNETSDERVNSSRFDMNAWERYFGNVGPEPELPENLEDILNDTCPFWPDKKIRDTHMLVLIPATINNEDFTLDKLSDIAKTPRVGHGTGLLYYPKMMRGEDRLEGGRSSFTEYPITAEFKEQFENEPNQRSYWILMTKKNVPLPGEGESHSGFPIDANALLSGKKYHYEAPKVLEAATSILTYHVRRGHRLYKTKVNKRLIQLFARSEDTRSVYTYCQEKPHLDNHSFFVGGFGESTLKAACGNKEFFKSQGFSENTSRVTYTHRQAGVSAVYRLNL